jgi:hypothetical protein
MENTYLTVPFSQKDKAKASVYRLLSVNDATVEIVHVANKTATKDCFWADRSAVVPYSSSR